MKQAEIANEKPRSSRWPQVQWAMIVVCVLAIVTTVALRLGSTSMATGQSYYLDLNSGELLVASTRHGTTLTRSGSATPAVMAYLFACSTCDSATRFGYVETIWPDSDGPPQAMTAFYDGDNAKNLHWVVQDSPEGEAVRLRVYAQCTDAALLRACHP